MAYVVTLKQFDGPLDLLLTLVNEAKVDIENIFVSEITEQYLESMKGIDELDMESASEFLRMASTLLEIKSRALIPKQESDEDDSYMEETPEKNLIRQLSQYKECKELAEKMKRLEKLAEAYITKIPEEYPLPPPNIEITNLTMEGLTRAFAEVLRRVSEREDPMDTKMREITTRDVYTVQNCMVRIQRKMRKGQKMHFREMFSEKTNKAEVIGVFLALLELIRLGKMHVLQDSAYSDIMLSMD